MDGRLSPKPFGGRMISAPNRGEAEYVYREVFEDRCYEPESVVPPGGVVLDVGANVGIFTLYAAEFWAPAKILAIEPNADLRESFETNTATAQRNGCQISWHACAAGAESAQVEFTFYPRHTIMSGRLARADDDLATMSLSFAGVGDPPEDVPREMWDEIVAEAARACLLEERRLVQVLTLDELVRREQIEAIEFLKIDVEGDEVEVLRGLSENVGRTVRFVAIEVDERRARVHDVVNLVEQWGLAADVAEDVKPEASYLRLVRGHRATE